MSEPTPSFHPTRDLLLDWRRGDGPKVAALFEAAGTGFPGGGGWQWHADQIERWLRQTDVLAAHVTEDDGRIVAMCNVMANPGQRESCYVPYLGCDPEFHGRKHGKSTLHAIVEWACRSGYRKVDLNTWAGNMKAVPLYKKTGFMWRPETTVFMENFVPSALAHPLGKAYFRRHDWYGTMERCLDLTEDLVTRGKVRVYEYRWRAADGDHLRMVFDRASWRLIEIETPELAASCRLPDEELVAGMPHPVRWQVQNKRSEPVQVFLSARGETGVDVTHRESRMVTGTATFDGHVSLDSAIPEKFEDPDAALLTTEITVGDAELELTNGIGVEQVVDVRLAAPRSIILPGEEQDLLLTLRSHLDRKATARLELRPVHNAALIDRSLRVDLGRRGSAEVPVRLRAPSPGTVALRAQVSVPVNGRRVETKSFELSALACPRDGLAASVGETTCVLCGGNLAVYVSPRSGHMDVHHRLRGGRAQRLHFNPPQIGPPFSWSDLFRKPGDAWVEEGPGSVSLHLRTESTSHPGLSVDRRIRLDRSPLVEIVDTITNGTGRPFDVHRRQFLRLRSRRALGAKWTMPVAGGPFTDYAAPGGRGIGPLNPPDAGEQWAEGWRACAGNDGVVSAVIWDRAEVVDMDGYIDQKAGRLAAGRSVSLPPLHLLVTDGDAHTVHSWWQLLHRPPIGERDVLPTPRRDPIELSLAPEPLVMTGRTATATLSLRHPGRYRLDGRIDIGSDEAVRTDVKRIEVSDFSAERPVEQPIVVRRRRQKGNVAGELALSFDSLETVYHSKARVLLLEPKAAPVEVTEADGLFTLTNGILTARIAPAFYGAMISLQLRGVEYLNSGYPEDAQRHWRNPWHGGVHLEYGPVWGRLHTERFRARSIERRGTQGLLWRGVRVTCRIVQKSARNQTLYADYLLAPGADVLAVVLGRRNTLGEWLDSSLAFNLWANLADAPGRGGFHTGDERITPQAGPHDFGDFTWDWGGLVANDGRALFVGSADQECRSGGWSGGPEGCILFGEACRELAAGTSEEGLFFVAPTASREEALARAPWAAFEALP